MFGRIKDFWSDPFDAEMDAVSWFLFIGFLIVCVILWRILLSHILDGAS